MQGSAEEAHLLRCDRSLGVKQDGGGVWEWEEKQEDLSCLRSPNPFSSIDAGSVQLTGPSICLLLTYLTLLAFLYSLQQPRVIEWQRDRQGEQASESRQNAGFVCTMSRQANIDCHNCCSWDISSSKIHKQWALCSYFSFLSHASKSLF